MGLKPMKTALMYEFPEFRTKTAARKYVKSFGYTELADVTESGDYGYGSREYYRKTDGSGATASISKVAGVWMVSK